MENPNANVNPSRISMTAYNGIIYTFFSLAVIMAITRTAFRVYAFRRLDADDYFLIIAILTLSAAVGLTAFIIPLAMLQNQVSLGQFTPGPSFPYQMLMAKKLEEASTITVWICIYSLKFSYMFLFKKLVDRVRHVRRWWWIVFALLVPSALVGSAFDWTICPNYTIDFLEACPIDTIIAREGTWLIVTTVIDVITDVLLISIPVMILWNVQIPIRAKLGIGSALCLSLFMIIVAIIRVALGKIGTGVTDTVWTYFTFILEACTAVFMVSLTAFRSTLGQHKKDSKEYKANSGSYTAPSRGNNTPLRSLNGTPKPQAREWFEKNADTYPFHSGVHTVAEQHEIDDLRTEEAHMV